MLFAPVQRAPGGNMQQLRPVMTAPSAPRDLSASLADLQAGSLAAISALTGESIGSCAIRLCREKLERSTKGGIAHGVWRRMSVNLRAYLIAECTNRSNPHGAAEQAWGDFSDDERISLGAAAREWRRQLESVGYLR